MKKRTHANSSVSKVKEELFPNSPHLVERFAKELSDGWYFNMNLSSDRMREYVKIIREITGLDENQIEFYREIKHFSRACFKICPN